MCVCVSEHTLMHIYARSSNKRVFSTHYVPDVAQTLLRELPILLMGCGLKSITLKHYFQPEFANGCQN